jgi:hypothetical protein
MDMTIALEQFGELLISRPEGKEAYLAYQPHLADLKAEEEIIIDCTNVEVLSPSWADEFITPLMEKYGERVTLIKGKNPSVVATFHTLAL